MRMCFTSRQKMDKNMNSLKVRKCLSRNLDGCVRCVQICKGKESRSNRQCLFRKSSVSARGNIALGALSESIMGLNRMGKCQFGYQRREEDRRSSQLQILQEKMIIFYVLPTNLYGLPIHLSIIVNIFNSQLNKTNEISNKYENNVFFNYFARLTLFFVRSSSLFLPFYQSTLHLSKDLAISIEISISQAFRY